MTTKPKVKKIKVLKFKGEDIGVEFDGNRFRATQKDGVIILQPLPTPKKSNSKPTKRGGRK